MWIFGTLIFFLYFGRHLQSSFNEALYEKLNYSNSHVSTLASFTDDYSMENGLLRQKGL